MSLVPGSRLGPYEIVASLGAGGMGEVYRARDARLGREIAVKVILPALAADPRRVKRFEIEARAAASLNHPNIVAIYDVGSEQGVRFVVMELAAGRSLRDLMREGPLPVRFAVEIALQAAAALEAAHGRGIVHRDLTPGNLVVSEDGRVKVLDFGLAKLLGDDAPVAHDDGPLLATAATTDRERSSISESGFVVGTIPYMAPEQVRGDDVDPRADLFALGVLLYEMVVGERPFVGRSAADVASSILRDEPIPVHRRRSDVPIELGGLIEHCLAKDPERRISSAQTLRRLLARIAVILQGGAVSAGGAASWESDDEFLRASGPIFGSTASPSPSVAVLPFANLSRDPEDEYFSEGLADELLNVLTKIPGLRVAGRTSSQRFKGRTEDFATIGRSLNAASLVEGSVRTAGNRARIAVRLVQASDGYQLWAGSYDRTLDDIFAVQDDIAQAVVKELRTTLMGAAPDSAAGAAAQADVAAAVRGRGEGGEAYRSFLKGRYFVSRGTRDDLVRGVGYLIEALQADGGFALAWAELAAAYAIEAGYGWAPVEKGIERARNAAERALSLEPDLAEGHVRLASVYMNYDRNFTAAEASLRRALTLAPGNALVLRHAGNLTSNLGRLDEAIVYYRRAVERDPLSPAGYQTLGIAYHAAGRLREAEEAYRTSLELGPQRVGPRFALSLVLLDQGREDEAMETAASEPEEVFRLMALAIIHHGAGRRAESDDLLRMLRERYAEGGAYQIAEVHAARGECDEAFAWLERAFAQRDGGLVEMKPEPLFRALHGDPRWDAFLQRMGLSP